MRRRQTNYVLTTKPEHLKIFRRIIFLGHNEKTSLRMLLPGERIIDSVCEKYSVWIELQERYRCKDILPKASDNESLLQFPYLQCIL